MKLTKVINRQLLQAVVTNIYNRHYQSMCILAQRHTTTDHSPRNFNTYFNSCIKAWSRPHPHNQVRTSPMQNGDVPVMIVSKPKINQFDSKAIGFKCQIEDKWHRIGYVVREALDDVHHALQGNNVMFAGVVQLF